MVNDLTAHINLNGRTTKGLVELLGQPDDIAELRDRYHAPDAAQWHIAFHLGPERRFFSIDDEWLVFHLDRTGRVTKVAVITD